MPQITAPVCLYDLAVEVWRRQKTRLNGHQLRLLSLQSFNGYAILPFGASAMASEFRGERQGIGTTLRRRGRRVALLVDSRNEDGRHENIPTGHPCGPASFGQQICPIRAVLVDARGCARGGST